MTSPSPAMTRRYRISPPVYNGLCRVGLDSTHPPHLRLYFFEGTPEECAAWIASQTSPSPA